MTLKIGIDVAFSKSILVSTFSFINSLIKSIRKGKNKPKSNAIIKFFDLSGSTGFL